MSLNYMSTKPGQVQPVLSERSESKGSGLRFARAAKECHPELVEG